MDYQAKPEKPENIQLKRWLADLYLTDPSLGSRRLVALLKRDYGVTVNRKRLLRLRRELGHAAI